MSYDSYIGRRQAKITALLQRNPSVREFIQELVTKLSVHAEARGGRFEDVKLDEPVVVNTTGDEYVRARILRG